MAETTRDVWRRLHPELRETLGHLATRNDGPQLTDEMRAAIKDNQAQDAAEAEGGQ